MAGYLNKAIIIGNLGRDPELSKTTGGNSVCSFSIATTERYTDKQGQKQEKTEWHNIVVWGSLAETAAKYLNKGSSICVEGKITTRSWDNKDGVKQYRTEIVASSFSFLDKLDSSSDGQKQGGFGGQQQAPQQQRDPSKNYDANGEELPF